MGALRTLQMVEFSSLGGYENMAADLHLFGLCEAGCDHGFLRFYTWTRPTLSLGFFESRDVVDRASCKVGEGIAGLVAERREGMLLLDDLMDPRLRTRRKVTDALSVPIIEEGELLGVLNLNTKKDKAFGEFDLFLLNTLIKQVSTAIVRGKRMEEIRLRLLELEEEEKSTLKDMQRLTAELDEKRRYYQRLRQQLDKLYRDLASLTGPVA